MTVDEIVPGIHRIESDLDSRFMAQYLLVGERRSLLVDTGIGSTPDEVLIPTLQRLAIEPDVIAISHADLDHSGGNRRMHERYPDALLACHELDRRWIASNQAMLEENYLWYEQHGFEPLDDRERADMLEMLGGDAPIDLGLRGGETFGLSDDFRVDLLHLPGHTFGHVGFWDSQRRIAIIIDAALSDGIYDRAGNKLIPPRYYDAETYRDSIRRIRALEPELLLTAHYPPMSRSEAREFCDTSLAFVDSVEAAVRESTAAGHTGLREVTMRVVEQLGPFPGNYARELGAGVRSHLS